MAIDVQLEKVISLNDAAKALPLIDGKRPHISTLWRWCRRGVRGVSLEYGRLGNRIVTSEEALTRFVNALAGMDTPPASPSTSSTVTIPKPTEKRRALEIERAKGQLEQI